MKDLYVAARRLYETAFPGEDAAFTDALFALAFPKYLHALGEGGKLFSMLFALPYSIVTKEGEREAYYLYAVATDPAARGKGYARQLLSEVAAKCAPVFLRPMSPSLFDFYTRAGLSPFSPYAEKAGDATPDGKVYELLDPAAYLSRREAFLKPPFCRMTKEFLGLSYLYGGAVALEGRFAALFEKDGDKVLFKEWCGDVSFAGGAAAFLGAAHYRVRYADADGSPFGMGVGMPVDAAFLAALD